MVGLTSWQALKERVHLQAGQKVFSFAEEIFSLGEDLLNTMKQRSTSRPLHIAIGIADSLPKLLTYEMLRPIFHLPQPVQASCCEGKVPDLLAHGRVRRPALGVQLAAADVVRGWRLEGALVVDVVPGSGAERAGLRPTRRDRRGRLELGDLIVAVDGEPVASSADLLLALERRRPGETVTVTVERDGARRDLAVVLGEGA